MQATRVLCLLALGSVAQAAPSNFIGVNAHQPQTDVLDGIKDLGASWVRIDLNWFQAQPSATTTPDFSLFDKMVAEATARGLKVFPTVAYGPAWASEPDTDGKPYNNVPKVGEYKKFCQAVAAHFQGKVDHIGLWNEPNLDGFFEGTKQQWIDRIVIEGIQGIKAGCPSCKVLGPELASIGDLYDTWLDDSLTQLKQKGLMYDIITWHIYSAFVETKPGWLCWDGDLFIHDLDQHRVCFGFHGRLSVREVMLKHSLGNLPVWISETGYTAPLGDTAAMANQVTYYRRVVEEQLKRSWWTHTFFYEIVDDNNINDKWGMAVRSGSSPSYPGSYQKKPVWDLIHNALAQQPALGGTGGDCNDGLDNDGDKLIDFPGDTGCSSAGDPTETAGTIPPDAGPPDAANSDGWVPWADGYPAADIGPGGEPSPAVDLSPGSDAPGSSDGRRCCIPEAPEGSRGPAPGDGDGCGCTVGATGSAPTLLLLLVVLAGAARSGGLARRRPARRRRDRRAPGC